MTFSRPRPGPPRGRPETVTVELVGGPHDGGTRDLIRPAVGSMPSPLPGEQRYLLAGVVPDSRPERWRYEWQPERTGRRLPCGKRGCAAAGCPNRRREPDERRPRPTPGPRT